MADIKLECNNHRMLVTVPPCAAALAERSGKQPTDRNTAKFERFLEGVADIRKAETFSDIAGEKSKQDKGCMPPKGGNCRFTPTGNAVRELQSVLLFALCVKVGIPMCRNKPISKRNTGIQKVFRKGKCYE